MYCTICPYEFKAVMILLSIGPIVRTKAIEPMSAESLAERHPYVVALLDSSKQYVCTGTIFSQDTVLTSAHCIVQQPTFVAVGLAVLWNSTNISNIFAISSTEFHKDYRFELKVASNISTYKFHSNIGVAIVNGSKLTLYIQPPTLRKFGTEELKLRNWTVVGYGKSTENPNMIALREEIYRWSPCLSLKWYYCVCGVVSKTPNNTDPFGEGAPLILDSQHLLGVTALPCGALKLAKDGLNYNMFTIVTPYITWINNAPSVQREDVKLKIRRSALANATARKLTDPSEAVWVIFAVCELLSLIEIHQNI